MKKVCDHDGCTNGIATGHALHRTSPKGTPFVGMCSEHYMGRIDLGVKEITEAFEQHNQKSHDARSQ